MISGAGSFRANPFALHTGNAGNTGDVRRRQTEYQPEPPVIKPQNNRNELSDIDNMFGSIFSGGGEDSPIPNTGSTGKPGSEKPGQDHGDVAKNYLSGYFQTNPAGKQVKVRPPEPPLFTSYQ